MSEQISVLIVDDHQIVRKGLIYTLSNFADFTIAGECNDGETAVVQALALMPKVVLMDIALPAMDGISATRKIKEKTSEVRILILTDHEHDNDVFAALSAGADGYCVKDASPENIAMAIRAVNSGACWLDPEIAKKVLANSHQKYDQVASDAAPGQAVKFDLSEKELEILSFLVQGLTNQEIATRSFMSNSTVKTFLRHIMRKLSVSDRTQAAVKAYREGLIPHP